VFSFSFLVRQKGEEMIKLENFEVLGWEHAIRGMRNPMNSWDKMDSFYCDFGECDVCTRFEDTGCPNLDPGEFHIGPNDWDRMTKLRNAGTDHRKYLRMITVYVDITAPLYWWKEFDTYKVGTVANSCSTMHKIHDKEFTLEDFSYEHLLGGLNHYDERNVPYLDFSPERDGSCVYSPLGILECCLIPMLNICREKFIESDTKIKKKEEYLDQGELAELILLRKEYWWQMIQLLPSSYNQKRTVMLNYEVLANMYKSRKTHKLDEWRHFCEWIETLPYSELITGKTKGEQNG
jgi:hypothetical protein